MKNRKSIIKLIRYTACLAAMSAILVPGLKVNAASDYTITISAGSEKFKNGEKIKKVDLDEGALIPELPGYDELEVPLDKYIITDKNEYKAYTGDGKVHKNDKIVVQYGKLNNGVEYKVDFIDVATNLSIHTPVIGREEAGSGNKITVEAPNITDYVLQDPTKTKVTFENLTTSQTYVFYYNYTGTGTGTTVITEEGVTTTITTPGGVETVYQENIIPTYVSTPVAGGGGAVAGGGAGGAGDANVDAADDENVVIDDGGVPLAPGDEKKDVEKNDKGAILEDEEVPKAAMMGNGITPISAVMASIVGVLAIAAIVFGITRFNKRRVAKVTEKKDNEA